MARVDLASQFSRTPPRESFFRRPPPVRRRVNSHAPKSLTSFLSLNSSHPPPKSSLRNHSRAPNALRDALSSSRIRRVRLMHSARWEKQLERVEQTKKKHLKRPSPFAFRNRRKEKVEDYFASLFDQEEVVPDTVVVEYRPTWQALQRQERKRKVAKGLFGNGSDGIRKRAKSDALIRKMGACASRYEYGAEDAFDELVLDPPPEDAVPSQPFLSEESQKEPRRVLDLSEKGLKHRRRERHQRLKMNADRRIRAVQEKLQDQMLVKPKRTLVRSRLFSHGDHGLSSLVRRRPGRIRRPAGERVSYAFNS